MKFLIWFGFILFAAVIQVLIPLGAIPVVILYCLTFWLAAHCCKSVDNKRAEASQQQNYRNQQFYQQRETIMKKEEDARKAKLEGLAKVTKETVICNADIESFLDSAVNCTSYKDILMLWDSLDPVDNETNAAIRKEIDDKVTTEKMYGTNPRGIPTFLANLEQTYGTAVIETVPTPEVVEEEVEEKPLTDMDVQFGAFLENAAQCGSYATILELWDSQNWSDPYAAVRKELETKYSTERMYGVIPRGIPKFLETLRQAYGTG